MLTLKIIQRYTIFYGGSHTDMGLTRWTRCIQLLPSSILMVAIGFVLVLDGYYLYSTCKVLGFGWLLAV